MLIRTRKLLREQEEQLERIPGASSGGFELGSILIVGRRSLELIPDNQNFFVLIVANAGAREEFRLSFDHVVSYLVDADIHFDQIKLVEQKDVPREKRTLLWRLVGALRRVGILRQQRL